MQQGGATRKEIAASLGISESAVKHRLERARKWINADPQVSQTAQAFGMADVSQMDHYWRRMPTEDGGFVTGHFKNATAGDSKDILADIAEAFKDIPPYEPRQAKPRGNDLLAVYPLMDAHFGMRAWGKETGSPDYDLSLAGDDLKQAFTDLTADMPDADTAILVLGGDTLHVDDNRSETPTSGHKLDSDGRLYKISDVAIDAITWTIDHLCDKHAEVIVRVLRGNHDPHAHLILHFSLQAAYGGAHNVTVEPAERDVYWYRHGKSLVAFHHGDKRNARDLAMFLADTCPEWSAARDRHILTGHIHHDSVKDFPGVKWWSLRAFCPADDFGAMFAGRRALQGFVYSAAHGLRMNVIEPIERSE
jgi:hypothetical protein